MHIGGKIGIIYRVTSTRGGGGGGGVNMNGSNSPRGAKRWLTVPGSPEDGRATTFSMILEMLY